jgi:hypothetical protein
LDSFFFAVLTVFSLALLLEQEGSKRKKVRIMKKEGFFSSG